jgi:AhpD family alkylhydroperoxidase
METKIKELIAIGASVTANCVPCLRFHLQQARKAGATPDEIQKAVGVGRMVRKGAAGKWDEEANALLSGEHDGEQEGTPPSCAET